MSESKVKYVKIFASMISKYDDNLVFLLTGSKKKPTKIETYDIDQLGMTYYNNLIFANLYKILV